MALLSSLAVRCSGLSRRSRAILWRSSPYFLIRRSRYDLSPIDACRSRTVAQAARFSRSTEPLVSHRSTVQVRIQVGRGRHEYPSATPGRMSSKVPCRSRTDLEQRKFPCLPIPLPGAFQDNEPISAIPILSSPPERQFLVLVSRCVLPPHRSVVPHGQCYQTSLELFVQNLLGVRILQRQRVARHQS